MTNRKISNFEFGALNYFITRALLIGITFNAIVNIMKQDSWIIPILSVIPSYIFILLINYIMKYEPTLDISEKIVKLFNKWFGKLLIFIMVIMFYFICIVNYLNLNNFVQSQFLSKTPIFIISGIFALASFYILVKGIDVISRTSNILFYIGFILFAISFIGLFTAVKFDNLKPFFTSNSGSYIKALNGYYAFNIVPMFLLTIIPKDKIEKSKIKKTLIISYLISSISIFVIVFQTIAIFGYELTSLYEYPEFLVLKHVTLVGLSSRIESILVMQLLFDIFIFNVFIIYFMSQNIKTLTSIKKSGLIYFIVCILVIIGTTYFSKYNIYLDSLMENWIPIIISIFSIIMVLLISIKIKMNR